MIHNELQVIKSAQQGNPTCFTQLVVVYQKQLSCYLLTKCFNSTDVEDIMQETFINAYKYIQSYDPQWKFSTWLYTIANRLVKKHNEFYIKQNDLNTTERTLEIENKQVSKENIWYHIRQILSSDAFDIIWFYYVDEFNTQETARILHCSQSKVKMSLFRSKRKLAKNKYIKLLFQELVELEVIL